MKILRYLFLIISLLALNQSYAQGEQEGGIGEEECVVHLSPNYVTFSSSGGSQTIKATLSSTYCSWDVSESVSWLRTEGKQIGRTTFAIVCDPNTATTSRSAIVYAGEYAVRVTQEGVPVNIYNVTGGGSYCAGGAGVDIGLSGSQSGATYTLKKGSSTITTRSGTGGAISFGKGAIIGNIYCSWYTWRNKQNDEWICQCYC